MLANTVAVRIFAEIFVFFLSSMCFNVSEILTLQEEMQISFLFFSNPVLHVSPTGSPLISLMLKDEYIQQEE